MSPATGSAPPPQSPVQLVPRPPPPDRPSRHVLLEWRPDDPVFWAETGKRVATRNLVLSIVALFLAFAVWMVWSVVAVKLTAAGFVLTNDQLFWLAALPGLSGATLRIFYAFMVPIVGGRRFTALTTASLLVPAIGIGIAVQDPSTPYWVLVLLAALAGLGGANFASSMANISFFFPKKTKGTALGLNAGLGNLGVSGVQLLAPLVIGVGMFGALGGRPQTVAVVGAARDVWLQNAAFLWVPLVAAAAIAAWVGMHDVASAKASFREQAVIFRRRDTWLVAWLYTGTFGSFIGFSAGLALLTKIAFPAQDPIRYAWIGPLVGALARPVGGWLADRLGGARVTLATFGVMGVAALGVISTLPADGAGGSFAAFIAIFVLLFAASGLGNGAVYRMIPPIFAAFHARRTGGRPEAIIDAQRQATKEAGAVVGFVSAIAAYGAFLVPKAFGSSLEATGGPAAAFAAFIVYYATCLAVTWWFYARKAAGVHA